MYLKITSTSSTVNEKRDTIYHGTFSQKQFENSFLQVKCVSALKKRPGRVEFQRGILFQDENGEFVVKSTGNQGSHVLSSMSKANCFIVLDQECGNVAEGSRVNVQSFDALM